MMGSSTLHRWSTLAHSDIHFLLHREKAAEKTQEELQEASWKNLLFVSPLACIEWEKFPVPNESYYAA